MDPNSQNSQEDSEAVKKLENDLNTLTEETKSVESQSIAPTSIPEEQPIVSSPVVEATPVVTASPEIATPEPQTAAVPLKPTKKSSPLMIVAIILIVLAVLAVIVYVFGSKLLTQNPKQTVCTLEAKICPDESSVGRTGPNCEFAACPTATPDVTANWKNYTNSVAGFGIKYPTDWVAINVAAGSNGKQALPNSRMIDISKIGKTETYPEGLMSIQIFDAKPTYPVTFTRSTGMIDNQVYEKYSTTIDQQLTSETYLFSVSDNKTFIEILIRYKTGDTYKEIFNQILSTFKFTDTQTVDEKVVVRDFVQDTVFEYGKSHGLTSKSQIIITVGIVQDGFAKGTTSFTSDVEGSGGSWFAAKVNGQWVVVEQTQEPPSCKLMVQYNFPKSVYGECVEK